MQIIPFEEKLKGILNKDINSLTPGDISFLRARRSYLTQEQLSIYKDILKIEVVQEAPEPKEDKLSYYRKLMKLAKEQNVIVPKGTKIDELKALLNI